jgi:hypothetical protein
MAETPSQAAQEPVRASDTPVQAGVSTLDLPPPSEELAVRAHRPAPSPSSKPARAGDAQGRPPKTEAPRATEQVDDLDDPLLDRRK